MSSILLGSDRFELPAPDAVRLRGLVGRRFNASLNNRLHHQEDDHLIWPFKEHCPVGMNVPDRPRPEIRGDWQGEYIGTWVDTAVLSAWNAGDEKLVDKINALVEDWLSTQQDDGYLGTYDEEDRWKSWDLWVQAHDMIGLLRHFWYTRDEKSLNAAIRIADRVLEDFGPGKRAVYSTGMHGGMASSAILEPMIWLYLETGFQRFLEWGEWLANVDWEDPNGPQIISTLVGGQGVANTANAKGIEMLICFAGLVELYRATGKEAYLEPVLLAWEDIVEHHLYITGSASSGEHFMKDFTLRNDGVDMVGETCVSMGWLYLNLKLGRLLGEARFFDMAEQTLYNHLLSAQSPDGKGWQYYTGLRDHKRYRWHTDPECCPSRGSRALAYIPMHSFNEEQNGIVVNFYDASEAELKLRSGMKVKLDLESDYPFSGNMILKVQPAEESLFSICLRLPGWCQDWKLSVNGEKLSIPPNDRGYLEINRKWGLYNTVEISLLIQPHYTVDSLGNNGRVAVVRGPLVFAADTAYLPKGTLLCDIVLVVDKTNPENSIQTVDEKEMESLHLRVPIALLQYGRHEGWWRENERYNRLQGIKSEPTINLSEIELVPFFEAGNREKGIYAEGVWPQDERVARYSYQVWLPFIFTD